jgi:hypothetical protein
VKINSDTQSASQRVADLGSVSRSIGSALQAIWTLKNSRDWSESFDSVETFIDLIQIGDDLQEIQDRIHRKVRKSSEGIK